MRQERTVQATIFEVFRACEDDISGQIEPEQQDDDGAKRAVGLVVASELRDVGGEGNRTKDP